MDKIKLTCKPLDKGGCGQEFFLEVPEGLDEYAREVHLRFAAMCGCRPCSIYQAGLFKLEDVRNKNQRIIWDHERKRDHLRDVLRGEPKNKVEIEDKIKSMEQIIGMARGDFALSSREIERLNEARKEQLSE